MFSRIASLAVLTTAWLGCHYPPPPPVPPPVSYFRAPEATSPLVRRVLVLPIEYETKPAAARRFRQALAAELQSAGLFEVVTPPEDACLPAPCHPPSSGRFDESFLAEMARVWQVDAVIYARLTAYDPYWPPRIGVTLHLVEVREATCLASVDGMWDARDAGTGAHAAAQQTTQTAFASLGDPDLVLLAPSYYEVYVACQVAGALAGKLDPVLLDPEITGSRSSALPASRRPL
jgi:hypothetical protein